MSAAMAAKVATVVAAARRAPRSRSDADCDR